MFNRKAKTRDPALPKPAPSRKRTNVAVLDFEGSTVHVVQASGSRVNRTTPLPLDLPAEKRADPKALAAALKAALESARIRLKEVVFALPRGQAVIRPLQVPFINDLRELASIINFQIAKELPFRIEDAVVDFKVLRATELPVPVAPDADPAAGGPRLEILVGAVKKDVVAFYRTVAQESGLKMEGLTLRPIGNIRLIHQASLIPPESAALIVALRTDETTIDVVDRQKLVFSRVAVATFPDNEEARGAFLQALQIEAVRSLHSYGGNADQQPVHKILVLGTTGLENPSAEALGAKLGLPVEIGQFADLDNENGGGAAAYGIALAALDPAGLPLDFENPKKPAVQRNTKRTQALVAIAAVLVIMLVLFGIRLNLIKKRQAVRLQVQTQLAEAEKKLPIYKRLKAQDKVVSGWISEEQGWLDHLAYLSSILPGADQIYVSAFTTTPQHLIRFTVLSKSGELLAELDKKLRAAGYEVKPLAITPANDKHDYNFRTTVELSIPKKMIPDLTKVKPPVRPADDVKPHASLPTSSAKGRRS